MPRYKVFFDNETMGMSRDQYTFLEYCNVDMKVIEKPFQLLVMRKETSQLIFSLESIVFKSGYIQVTTKDAEKIWGLGERFQSRFHVEDGLWTIWNRDRPWIIDDGGHAKSGQTYGHNPLYLAH